MWKNRPKITFTKFIEDKKSALRDLWNRFLIVLHIRKTKIEKKKNVLPDLPEEKIDPGAFIERHRFALGGILIVLILISGGYLLYRENYFKPALERKIAEQDVKIINLESKINELAERKPEAAEAPASTPATQVSDQSGSVSGASTASATKPVGKVNINTASATQLDTLPGIGTAYAGRIIEYRTSHGGFKSTVELKNVKGIGDKTFEKMADLVTI